MYQINIDRPCRTGTLHLADPPAYPVHKNCRPPKRKKDPKNGYWKGIKTVAEGQSLADSETVKFYTCTHCRKYIHDA